MATIYHEPTNDIHILHTSIPSARMVEVPLTADQSYLIDPVSNKKLAESITQEVGGLEDRSNSGESISRDQVTNLSNRIIQRAKDNLYKNLAVISGDNASGVNPANNVAADSSTGSANHSSSATDYLNSTDKKKSGEAGLGEFWKAQKDGIKGAGGFQQTVGGSDMSVFYLAEVPVIQDLVDGIAKEDARKEIIVLEMDNVLSLQYSLIREVYPVRQLGNINPVDYTRGPRTIAGHIAFAVFAEDVLNRLRSRVLDNFANLFDSVDQKGEEEAAKLYRYYDAALHFDAVELLDSLPPFHLLVMGVNENGVLVKFLLKNLHIIDENQLQGTRQPNVMNKVSFTAIDIVPMHDADPSRTITESMDEWTPGKTSSSPQKLITKKYSASQALKQSIQRDLEV